MNESYFESIFAIFDEKSPFLSILDTFWTIFGHFSYSTSIKESLTIELNYLLNWISRIFFELNNILNWILGKAILNWILNESFFWQNSKIELNQIGYRTPLTYSATSRLPSAGNQLLWKLNIDIFPLKKQMCPTLKKQMYLQLVCNCHNLKNAAVAGVFASVVSCWSLWSRAQVDFLTGFQS